MALPDAYEALPPPIDIDRLAQVDATIARCLGTLTLVREADEETDPFNDAVEVARREAIIEIYNRSVALLPNSDHADLSSDKADAVFEHIEKKLPGIMEIPAIDTGTWRMLKYATNDDHPTTFKVSHFGKDTFQYMELQTIATIQVEDGGSFVSYVFTETADGDVHLTKTNGDEKRERLAEMMGESEIEPEKALDFWEEFGRRANAADENRNTENKLGTNQVMAPEVAKLLKLLFNPTLQLARDCLDES